MTLLNMQKEVGYLALKNDEKFQVVDFWGHICLFTNGRISQSDMPEGLYRYDLREKDDGDGFCTVEPFVLVNHGGTILTKHKINFDNKRYIELNDDNYPNFCTDYNAEMTIGQYLLLHTM